VERGWGTPLQCTRVRRRWRTGSAWKMKWTRMVRRRAGKSKRDVQRDPKFRGRIVMDERHYACSDYQQNCIQIRYVRCAFFSTIDLKRNGSLHAMMFCGLYICVMEIVAPATMANGATTNVTEKKSTADLREYKRIQCPRNSKRGSKNPLHRRSAFHSLKIHRPTNSISTKSTKPKNHTKKPHTNKKTCTTR
jgi:hypothetical protein